MTTRTSGVAWGRVKSLVPILTPKSIAVIGASRNPDSVGGALVRNLLHGGFAGAVYPVNPQATAIDGVRCYASIAQIPDPIDLAVLAVRAPLVPELLEVCGQKQVKGVIVISAGFRETGEDGARLEERMRRVIERYGMVLIGPNCLGVLNTDPAVRLNATFAKEMPAQGPIAFISQSGALCTAVLEYARGEGIGFSTVVSLGNKLDVNELDLLLALQDDPQTRVILLYVEELAQGRRFIEIAREITGEGPGRKPILALKAGRTPPGAHAAQSHTGALAGSDEAYDAIFAQAGVLRVESVEELFDDAVAFAHQPLPQGRRVAIVTNAGGPGIMTTDACVRYGLELASLGDQTLATLQAHLPNCCILQNPIDLIGDAQHDRYAIALQAVVRDPAVESAIVVLTPQAMTDVGAIAREVTRVAEPSPKPILACFMGTSGSLLEASDVAGERVPQYRFPESAVRALAAMSRYVDWIQRPRTEVKTFPVDRATADAVLARAAREGRAALTQSESLELLRAYGFPAPPFATAATAEEARRAAVAIGFPVAMKILSADILHKIDVGGVRLNLGNPEAVAETFRQMWEEVHRRDPDAQLEGVLLQSMVPPGTETIIGMTRDRQFGPLLMFGLGGIYVEAWHDVAFRLAPIKTLGAQRMVESIRAHQILEGFRGQPPADVAAIAECLERLSQLAVDRAEIAAIDINPLIVYPHGQGVKVADARVLLGS